MYFTPLNQNLTALVKKMQETSSYQNKHYISPFLICIISFFHK